MHRKRRWITRVRILIVSAALQRNGCEHGKRPPLCVEALTAARHQKGAHRQSSPKPNRLTGSAGLTRPRVSRGRSPVPPSGTSATRGPAADHHQFRPESRKTQSPASLHLRVCCALRLDARSQSLRRMTRGHNHCERNYAQSTPRLALQSTVQRLAEVLQQTKSPSVAILF